MELIVGTEPTWSSSDLFPILIDDELAIHDSHALIEYINECSSGSLYRKKPNESAIARSLCAKMHAGFTKLRNEFPFQLARPNIDVELSPKVAKELERIEDSFSMAQIPFMFDTAFAIDAFYAVLAFRLHLYGVELIGIAGKYQKSLLLWSLLQKAILQAKQWGKKQCITLV